MADGPAPMLVFADDWGRHPSSCQHLVRHLLGRREVQWVNTIGMRPPRLDRATCSRGIEVLRRWSRPGPPAVCRPASEPAIPQVLSPTMWPWLRSAFDRRLNRELLLRQLTPIVESASAPPIAVTTIPIVADLIGRLPVARWVYYCVDDFGQWPGLDRAPLAALEGRLVERADVLVAAGEELQGRLARMGRESHLLDHGVDLDHWSGTVECLPPQLEGLPHPLVVFWGVIDRRMDTPFLARLASDLAAGTILLVGPEQDPDPALAALPRLVRLPSMPYESLPGLAREAAVLIMPYADLPVTRAMQPLKLKEYLATGLPAVVRDLPATRPWSDCLDLADSPEGFSRAVRARLATGLADGQRAARVRLVDESWTSKALAFERIALEPLEIPAGCPT